MTSLKPTPVPGETLRPDVEGIRKRTSLVGPGGINITGGIPSEIYVRLQRDECSEAIWDYVYELIEDRRSLLSYVLHLEAQLQTAKDALEFIANDYNHVGPDAAIAGAALKELGRE